MAIWQTAILDYSGTMPLPTPGITNYPIHIDRFDIQNWEQLEAVPTVGLAVGTVFNLITTQSGDRVASVVELGAGPATAGDTSESNPDDYDPVANNKHWAVVGGYFPNS